FAGFFSSRRRHTRFSRDWSSDVCSSDLAGRRVGYRRLIPLDTPYLVYSILNADARAPSGAPRRRQDARLPVAAGPARAAAGHRRGMSMINKKVLSLSDAEFLLDKAQEKSEELGVMHVICIADEQ